MSSPPRRVVVVGAGLSGLSAALYLTGAGVEVTVLERADHPGGRVGRYRGPDYEIDSGATVLTMPELIDDALGAVGAARDGLDILALTPAYHARFADGSTIDVFSDADAMAAQVAHACGPDEARRYRRLRHWLGRVFAAEYDSFLAADFDSPLDLVSTPRARRDLAELVALGGFGRLGAKVERTLRDPRLRRLFTFQALYAGTSPAQALGVYAAIPYMDTCLGVFFPRGGMRAIAARLAEALIAAGGTVELTCTASGFDRNRDGRVTGVRSADGRTFDCDAAVLTVDLGSLGDFGVPVRRGLRASPSAVVAHGTIPVATTAGWAARAHHTIDFGAAWRTTFAEITARRGRGRPMRDPSLLLTRPAFSDPTLLIDRPDGPHEPLSVLAPCPNLVSAPLDWSEFSGGYLAELLGTLERRGYHGIATEYTVDHLDTPDTWQAAGMLAGTPFSAAHLFRQTGPFRTRNTVRGLPNVVLAGCGTVPGVGVPTALLSGKLAAARVLRGVSAKARRR
jgi:phytoene desaturase